MVYLFLTFVFLLGMAFFSGIETGLISMMKPRVRHGVKSRVRGAGLLHFFLQHPGYLLATTLIGTNICVVCASNMAKMASEQIFQSDSPSVLLATGIILTFFCLTVEIVPKDWFRQQPYERCLVFAHFLYLCFIVLYVPVRVMSWFTDFICRISGGGQGDGSSGKLMREDFRILLRESEKAGIIDGAAAEILDRSVDFHSLTARDIQQEKDGVFDIPSSLNVREAAEICRLKGKSRLPVRRRNEECWCGVFSLYDAIFKIPEDRWDERKVGDILRPLSTVPENANPGQILTAAKRSGSHVLIVVDSRTKSRHLGIVTPIDVAKNLFG